MVRPGGFELPAFWFVGKQSKILSAAAGVAYKDPRLLSRSRIGPKLTENIGVNPLRWHSFFGHSFRFRNRVLASPNRRRGLGKGTASESLPQQSFRNLFVVLFVLKKLHRRASRFDLTFSFSLELFRGSIAQRRV